MTTLTYLNPPSANANPTPEQPNTTTTTTTLLDEIRKAIDTPTTNDLVTHPCEGRLSTPKDNTTTTTLTLDDTHEIECGGRQGLPLPYGVPKNAKLNDKQINIGAFKIPKGTRTYNKGGGWSISKDKDGHSKPGGKKAYKLCDPKDKAVASLTEDGLCIEVYRNPKRCY